MIFPKIFNDPSAAFAKATTDFIYATLLKRYFVEIWILTKWIHCLMKRLYVLLPNFMA